MHVGPLAHLLWEDEKPGFSSINVTRIQDDVNGTILDTKAQRRTED